MEQYVWVHIFYTCSHGHENGMERYYLSHSGVIDQAALQAKVQSGLPKGLACDSCPSGTFPSGRVRIGMKVHLLSSEQFSALGVTDTPEALDSPIM